MVCKAIMYHYVRPADSGFPGLYTLHIDDFQRQLDYFEREFGFVGEQQWHAALDDHALLPDGIILTFDDGLTDHYQHVFPILKERELWGIFYISSAPLRAQVLLHVHRIHYLLGRFDPKEVLDALESIVNEKNSILGFLEKLKSHPYEMQSMDAASIRVKMIVNYALCPKFKDLVLDRLFEKFNVSKARVAQRFYLNRRQIQEMSRAGLAFGAHGATHNLLTKVAQQELTHEVSGSIDEINDVLHHSTETFCYPYGGPDSWNNAILEQLRVKNIRYGFCVEPSDITSLDLQHRPLVLPRYDCNQFPYGKARISK